MSLYKQFETNPELEKKGIWVEYEDGEEKPSRFLIARAGGANTAFNKAMEAAAQPIRRKLQNNLVGVAELRKLNVKVFSETVILGWENVKDAQGNELAFTRENVVKLFTDLPDLFDDIQEQAGRAVLYRKVLQEQDSGN